MEGLPYNLTSLTKWCVGLTGVYLLCEVILTGLNIWLLWYIEQVETGGLGAIAAEIAGTRYDEITLQFSVVFLVAFVIANIANAIWIYRSSANAAAIDPEENRITAAWAIGWFVVPIMSLWKPFVAMRQTVNTSIGNPSGMDAPLPKKYLIWWGAWVMANALGWFAFRTMDQDTMEGVSFGAKLDIAGSVFSLIAGVLFVTILLDITKAQAELATRNAMIFE